MPVQSPSNSGLRRLKYYLLVALVLAFAGIGNFSLLVQYNNNLTRGQDEDQAISLHNYVQNHEEAFNALKVQVEEQAKIQKEEIKRLTNETNSQKQKIESLMNKANRIDRDFNQHPLDLLWKNKSIPDSTPAPTPDPTPVPTPEPTPGPTVDTHRQTTIPTVPLPDSSNTVIYMVAGGERLRISYDVEMLIRSLRVSGNFTGAIVVFVDSDESVNKFTASLNDFKNVYIQNVAKDLYPVDDNGDKIKFLQTSMYYKRLKVTGRNYIQENPSLKGSKYALYLDTDIIVTSDMAKLLEDIHAKVVAGWNKMMKDTFSSFLCMWKSPGWAPHDEGAWQGGQIFSNFPNSDICMESYKKMIDEMGVNETSDQKILKATLKKPNSTCKVIEIPGGGGYNFNLASPNMIKLQEKAPTITHITNYRLKCMESEEDWKRFVKTFLGFQIGKNATETVGITNITWEEAIVAEKTKLFGVMKRRHERERQERERQEKERQEKEALKHLAAMQNMTLQNSTSKTSNKDSISNNNNGERGSETNSSGR